MLIWLALLLERITARLATIESLFLLGSLRIPSFSEWQYFMACPNRLWDRLVLGIPLAEPYFL